MSSLSGFSSGMVRSVQLYERRPISGRHFSKTGNTSRSVQLGTEERFFVLFLLRHRIICVGRSEEGEIRWWRCVQVSESCLVGYLSICVFHFFGNSFWFELFCFSLSPLDNLVRAVLYLHQCEPDHAQAALFSIPKVPVILCSNFFCLTDPSTVKVLVSSSLKWFSCSI